MAKTTNGGNDKVCAALSYILIGIIWYFADEKMKKSGFAKYHAKQGMVLLIAAIIYSIILQIIFSILFIPMIMGGGFTLYPIIMLLGYIPLIWAIIGIINAVNGKEKPLPIIGGWANKLSF